MAKRSLLVVLLFSLCLPVTVHADDNPCPCVPRTLLWTVEACETWNCAQAALIQANGDPYVMSMPTNSAQYKWIVMRRIVSGSSTVSPNAPFLIDSYSNMGEAFSAYATIDSSAMPMMFSAVDGAMLVVRLREASRRPNARK